MRISNRKIFGLHPKVMLPQYIYECNFVEITLVGPTKVSIMKLKCSVLNRMWQHNFMRMQIFFSSIFLSENTGQLAMLSRLITRVMIPDTHGIIIQGKDVAKILPNKLSTLVFDSTFISLHVSNLRQSPLQVILHFHSS